MLKGRLDPGENRVVDCTVNSSGVPADAKGVLLNLTAANPASTGNLAVRDVPDVSNLPFVQVMELAVPMSLKK